MGSPRSDDTGLGPTELDRRLGRVLADIREAHQPQVTQRDLARQLGWSPMRMNRTESGQRRISVADVVAICQVLRSRPMAAFVAARIESDSGDVLDLIDLDQQLGGLERSAAKAVIRGLRDHYSARQSADPKRGET